MQRISFCEGWEFSRDDDPFEEVVIPHDAMLGNRRDAQAPGGSASGYYYGADYHYRKQFDLTEEQARGALLLEFEAVYRESCIRINGMDVETPPYGFVPFFVDIAHVVRPGQNTIEVDCSNADQPDCRWYSGGGIMRPVWLWSGNQTHIAPEGIRVTTVSINPAVVHVDIAAGAGDCEVSIVDDGQVIAQATGRSVDFELPDASLWSADEPYLYQCHVSLHADGEELDAATTSFGIRMLEWDTRGLRVNGRETLLRGGCIHCDNGVLGAASFAESERRRVRLLKKAGFNALRIAHNPAPASLLQACDELGMYVMDETWDVWYTPKSAHDYSQWFLDWCDRDLRRLASRDYNHPSVIMYSIGNEIADPIAEQGVLLEHSMVALLHSLDPTRPVTCGFNLTMMVMERVGRGWYKEAGGVAESSQNPESKPRGSLLFNLAAQAAGTGMTRIANLPGADKLVSPALDALDIAGYNYAAGRYEVDARKHPGRIMLGTETFPHELAHNWELVKDIPAVIGDFMWAGWDYLGEAGAGAWAYTPEEAGFSKPWPWLIAGSGALDILGTPNAAAALAGAVWKTIDKPSIQVRPVNVMNGKTYKATWRGSDAIPSWSWQGCEGTVADVEVYDGRAHAIRIELNGTELATKRVRSCIARFDVEYEPGILTATALDEDGHPLAHASLASARPPLRLAAHLQTKRPKARGVAYVEVNIEGRNGEVESNADALVNVEVEDGALLGFGSARPATTERFESGEYTTYRGRALAVVYRAEAGVAKLTAQAEGLPAATQEITFE